MTEHPVPRPRHPALVPDDHGVPDDHSVADPDGGAARFDVSGGLDTDGDGRPDTVVTDDGVDLVLLTDLDGDGFADQILLIGQDAVVREVSEAFPIADGSRTGAEMGYEP